MKGPNCEQKLSCYDQAEERTWRYANMRRCRCPGRTTDSGGSVSSAVRGRLAPVVAVAPMISRKLDNVISCCPHSVTHSVA